MSEQKHPKISVLVRKKFVSKFDDEDTYPDSFYGKVCGVLSSIKKIFFNSISKQDLRDYEYISALDKLIYDTGNCIAGWDREEITGDRSVISYRCTTDYYSDADVEYLRDNWLKHIEDFANVKIIDNMSASGEVFVDFI